MPIFIPVFLILFVGVPVLLTNMAVDLLRARGVRNWIVIFIVIAALNWQAWQTPRPAAPVATAAAFQVSR